MRVLYVERRLQVEVYDEEEKRRFLRAMLGEEKGQRNPQSESKGIERRETRLSERCRCTVANKVSILRKTERMTLESAE
jgi:hypothetical protein